MKGLTLAASAVLCVSQTAAAEDEFSKVAYKVTTLTPSMHMLEGAGGNITALIGPDGTLLVDDDFAQMAGKLAAKLEELKGASPRFIVNTHFHYDHTGGNEVFGPTATIIAAEAARRRLMGEQILWHKKHGPVAPQALPILTFDQSLTLRVNNEEVRIVHYPHGHTDGDTVVFFNRAKVVSMGDLYFSGMFPIFHPEHDGSLEGYVRNLKSVLQQTPAQAQIVSGHGPLSGRPALEEYCRMIEDSIATVKAGIQAGRTLEQIQKTGLAPKWEPFSHGYRSTDQWLGSIYESLKKGGDSK